MPIVRREEQPDLLSPQVLYLWKRRWRLILPALIVTVATYFITYLVKEEFVASAQLFVNRYAAHDDEGLLPNPGSVVRLLESDELLYQVRNDFVQHFGGNRRDVPLERFSKMFRVRSEVLQDTSVKKEMSPVLTLSLQAQGQDQTRFLMESWLRHFMEMFGNYATAEAVLKRDALAAENEKLEAELETAEQELERLQGTLPLQQKIIQEMTDALAPSDLPQENRSGGVVLGQSQGVVTRSNTQVNLSLGQKQPGLVARLVQLKVEENLAENGGTTASLEQVRREQAAVTAAIEDTRTSVAALQESVSRDAARASSLERRIQMMTAFQTRLRDRLSHFSIAASVYRKPGSEGAGVGGDVRILSSPVTPEQKVWPRRTLTALSAGLLTFVFSAALLLALRAMRRASAEQSQPAPPEVVSVP